MDSGPWQDAAIAWMPVGLGLFGWVLFGLIQLERAGSVCRAQAEGIKQPPLLLSAQTDVWMLQGQRQEPWPRSNSPLRT